MKRTLILVVILGLVMFPIVNADAPIPTMTKVYFEKNNLPYNGQVDYTLSCLGYTYKAGSQDIRPEGSKSIVVFAFSGKYKNYGDKIYENYYLNYRHIDNCTLTGSYEGQKFRMDFSEIPVNFSQCRDSTESEKNSSKGYKIDRTCELRFTIPTNESSKLKIMPETASEKAIERLGQLNFNITLKDVGNGTQKKSLYEATAEKEAKIFGLFKKQARVSAEIDAETGEVIKVNKPWWAFLASGI